MSSFLSFLGFSFLIQFFSKIISFGSNQLLIRSLPPSLFGLWSVRLSIISDTIVFWSRDGVRKSASRSKNPKKYSILPLIFGIIISPIVFLINFYSLPNISGFIYAVLLTCLGSIFELIGEIWAIPQLASMEGNILAKVSGPAFLIKSLSAIFLTSFYYKDESSTFNLMISFGLSNLLYGLIIPLGFLFFSGLPNFEFPTKIELISLRPFAFQTILQWLFSQGERLILLFTRTQEEIGVYGFVSDIASLIARLIFAPIESSIFTLCATSNNPPIESLSMACRFVTYIGLGAMSFGPHLAPPLMKKIYGNKWNNLDSQKSLSTYFKIMPFLAINGITEAYSNARLTSKKLEIYNLLLTFISLIYFILMYYLGKNYGISGTIYSNGINMFLRSLMALYVIFKDFGLIILNLFPNFFLIILFLIILFLNNLKIINYLILIVLIGFLILYFEKSILKQFFILILKKK